MEKHDDENQEQPRTVTLIFQNQRFEVDKQKLIQRSEYFAALFSPKFKEFHQTEHKIHVEYPLAVFQVSFFTLF